VPARPVGGATRGRRVHEFGTKPGRPRGANPIIEVFIREPMKLQNAMLLVFAGLIVTWVSCATLVPAIRNGPGVFGETPPAAEVALPDPSELPPIPGDREQAEGLERLRLGMERSAAGDPDGAAVHFERAAELLPPFADWARVLAARAYATRGDVGETRRWLGAAGVGGASEWGWRTHQLALLQAGDTAAAARVGEGAAEAALLPTEQSLAWASVGELRSALTDPDGALEAHRRAMTASRQSPGGLRAARAAHDLPGLSPEDRLLVGMTLLSHGGVDRAVPMIEAYLAAAPAESRPAAEARLEAGRSLFNARRYDLAERFLRGAAAQIPEAAFLLARTRYRAGQRDAGVQGFLAVQRDHPETPAAADALFLLGDLAHDDNRISSAREHYWQTIATGAHNVSAADAAVRLAGIAVHGGDGRTAAQDLDAYLATRPRDAVSIPAVYWRGRAHLLQGETTAAEARFREVLETDPFSYYGMLAADRLGTSLRTVPLPESPPVDPGATRSLEHVFYRIDVLRELGLVEEGDFEMARLQAQVGDDHGTLYTLAEGMSERGQPIAGALLGRRVHQQRGQWDDRLLRIVYQFPFQELVMREARRNRLDPFAVAGLIRQESFFNPTAVSPAGAVGLMQVMPQTASGLARGAGISGFQASMLRDPDINVRLGTLFLANQMTRWNGRLSDVYAAYNAGPNRVVRWRQLPEHRDDEVYVERIPIAETRDYVKRVRLNGEIYRRLYAQPE